MAIKLVTDSTCDLPSDLARQMDITVIPCNVHFDDEVYKDGVDIGPDEFYARLVTTTSLPKTAQPSVNDFLQVYEPLSSQGHDVLSIHLSAKLSGTLNSATQAREALLAGSQRPSGQEPRIEIIDSLMASSGLGLVDVEAARMINGGSTLDEVLEGVQQSMAHTHCYFLLDTLEYLQKGGRIGRATAFLGSLLNIKPILMIKDGEAHSGERARTRDKGLRRLTEIVGGLAPAKALAIIHSTAPEEADLLRERLGDLVPQDEIVMARFSPVVGTYLGPGALGVAVMSSS